MQYISLVLSQASCFRCSLRSALKAAEEQAKMRPTQDQPPHHSGSQVPAASPKGATPVPGGGALPARSLNQHQTAVATLATRRPLGKGVLTPAHDSAHHQQPNGPCLRDDKSSPAQSAAQHEEASTSGNAVKDDSHSVSQSHGLAPVQIDSQTDIEQTDRLLDLLDSHVYVPAPQHSMQESDTAEEEDQTAESRAPQLPSAAQNGLFDSTLAALQISLQQPPGAAEGLHTAAQPAPHLSSPGHACSANDMLHNSSLHIPQHSAQQQQHKLAEDSPAARPPLGAAAASSGDSAAQDAEAASNAAEASSRALSDEQRMCREVLAALLQSSEPWPALDYEALALRAGSRKRD